MAVEFVWERATRVPAPIWAAESRGKQSEQIARTHKTTAQGGLTSVHGSRRTRAHVFGQGAGKDPFGEIGGTDADSAVQELSNT